MRRSAWILNFPEPHGGSISWKKKRIPARFVRVGKHWTGIWRHEGACAAQETDRDRDQEQQTQTQTHSSEWSNHRPGQPTQLCLYLRPSSSICVCLDSGSLAFASASQKITFVFLLRMDVLLGPGPGPPDQNASAWMELEALFLGFLLLRGDKKDHYSFSC